MVLRNRIGNEDHSRVEVYPGPIQMVLLYVLVDDIAVEILLYCLDAAVYFGVSLRELEKQVVPETRRSQALLPGAGKKAPEGKQHYYEYYFSSHLVNHFLVLQPHSE